MLHSSYTFEKESKMPRMYRVVCTENQSRYPNKIFIDILPADPGSTNADLTHSMLIEARKLSNPGVSPVLTGGILTEFEDGSVYLKYETQKTPKTFQLEQQIIDTFKDMRQRGKDRTIDVSFAYTNIINTKDIPINARQAKYIEEAKRLRDIQARHDDVIHRGHQEKIDPIIMMKARLNRYQGD